MATFTPLQAKNDHSGQETIVYIYRPSTMANVMYSPDLYINDEYRVSIKSGANHHFTLEPGVYSFKLERDDKIFGNSLNPETLHAGSVYYYRIDTTLKITDSSRYQPYQREFTLSAVDELLARQQIAECCLKKEVNADKSDEINKIKTDSEFSVDKTQNPFSR